MVSDEVGAAEVGSAEDVGLSAGEDGCAVVSVVGAEYVGCGLEDGAGTDVPASEEGDPPEEVVVIKVVMGDP